MSISITDFGDVKVLYLENKLDVSLSLAVEADIDKMIDSGVRKIVIDLRGVEYLSSSGLRIFISSMRKINELDGKLVLSSITPMVRKIFKIVELEDLFQIYNNAEEAVRACQ